MSNTYNEAADKSTLTVTGEAPPYTTEEMLLHGKLAWNTLVDAVDDTAAATAGVDIGHVYRTGSTLKVRVA